MEHEWRAAESEADRPGLRWPPPGLERLQGDLWSIAASAALAGGLMVLPMLFVVARGQSFASLGPLADAWWVMPLLATLGLGFSLDAFARTARLLLRAAWAIERGYDWITLAYVVADARRDMGFLLQGGRHFSVLGPDERKAVAALRVASVSGHACAGLWLSLSLGVGLLLAARGWITAGTLWKVTLFPPLLLHGAAMVAAVVEESRVRRARRKWYDRPWAHDLATGEIRAWRAHLASRPAAEIEPGGRAPAARRTAVLVGAAAVLVVFPVMTVVPTSAIGPLLTLVAAPRFEATQKRAAEAEALRSFGVEVDPNITPGEAGRILHMLMFVGSDRPVAPGEQEPSLRVQRPWLPEAPDPEVPWSTPERWSENLFTLTTGASTELRAYLATIAGHPAQGDFSRLARAGELDAAAARWTEPFPRGTTLATVPIPRFGELRTGAYAHLAAAAYELVNGRPERAQTLVREVISVGFLMIDRGPTLIDNLLGEFLVREGGRALESLYEVSGREADLSEVRRLRAVADRAAARIHPAQSDGAEALVRALPGMVTDPGALRGLRWEHFTLLTTLHPCLNMHRIVFGPDSAYAEFVEEAHRSLVEWPSEEGLFELARGGYLRTADESDSNMMGRVLGLAMRSGEATCGQVVTRFGALRALF